MFWVNPDVVNKAKQNLSESLEGYCFVDTNAAGFTTDKAHYDAHSELELGRLFGMGIIEAH